MATLRSQTTDASRVVADTVVVGVGSPGRRGAPVVLAGGAGALDAAFGGRLAEALTSAGATGRVGDTTRIPTMGATRAHSILAVGLGDASAAYSHETLRRASGTAARTLAGVTKVATTLAEADGGLSEESLRAVAEGSLLGSYDFVEFRKTTRVDRPAPVSEVVVLTSGAVPTGKVRTQLRRAEVLAESVSLVRDLVNTPPGDLPPARLAEIASDAAKSAGMAVEVLDERALRQRGFGGLTGVGQGSVRPPRLVRLSWPGTVDGSPRGSGRNAGRSGRRGAAGPVKAATRGRRGSVSAATGSTGRVAKGAVHLVGKGITFDSGGLSLKPSTSMEWMKADMAGSASVLATALAAARLELPVPVTAWMALAENMPSGSAIRPGDVLNLYGGTRVEVLNTDAEGRLVLGDALARASEESPRALIDVATLTGAQIVALGHRVTGMMGNDDALRDALLAAAAASGEQLWPMPLPDELRKGLDSTVADLKNIGDPKSGGGMLVAGLFLREFVGAGVPWAHLDIAGPSYNEAHAWGATPRGATGVIVSTLLRYIEDLPA